jgi:hypothetical protein
MYSFKNFNLLCICEHIPCSWLVNFFVLLVINERASTNTLCWILRFDNLLNPLSKPLTSCFRCAFVWTHFFFSYSCFGCAQIEVHETLYIDTRVESIYQLGSYFPYWYIKEQDFFSPARDQNIQKKKIQWCFMIIVMSDDAWGTFPQCGTRFVLGLHFGNISGPSCMQKYVNFFCHVNPSTIYENFIHCPWCAA